MGDDRAIDLPIEPSDDDEPDPRPYEKLATAIIVRAVRDARYTPPDIMPSDEEKRREIAYRIASSDDAQAWLLSAACRFFCHSLGIDFAIVETWVYAGCPKPPDALAMADDFGFGGYKRRVQYDKERDRV